jgi:oligoendopeptidase F
MAGESTRWDLTDLYSGPDDPQIVTDQADALAASEAFARRFQGRLASLDGPGLAAAFIDFEELMRGVHRPRHYASLRFAVATGDPDVQAALAQAQAFGAQVDQQLAFWGVELKELTEEHLDGLDGVEQLAPWRHYLTYERQFAPYTLSEPEERTIALKDVTGKTAWVNLYTQLTSGLRFEVEVDGETRSLTRGEVDALAVRPDRDLRERAAIAFTEGFAPQREVLTFAFNTLFEDHRLETDARSYDDVLQFTVLSDELDRPVVDSLITAATDGFDIVHRYHALRSRELDLPDYAAHDLRVPAFGAERSAPFDESKQLVLEAYERFSPQAATVARRFFDERWVDVFPRPGKSSGAFCSYGYPPAHPWVLLNHTDTLGDVFTIAHELGHGLHGVLAGIQTPLNFHAGRAMAETASVFAELWLHERLMEGADDTLRLQLLDRQVRDAVGTAFNQVAYINWERRAHAARAEGTVSGEACSAIWTEEMHRLMGDAVRLEERDGWRWISIPHFIFARFYCYSYAFGKLLTLGLHALWREQGDEFVREYLAMLASGGSRSPADLVATLGLDLADPAFWQRAVDVVRGYLVQLEDLADRS